MKWVYHKRDSDWWAKGVNKGEYYNVFKNGDNYCLGYFRNPKVKPRFLNLETKKQAMGVAEAMNKLECKFIKKK